MSQFQLPGIPQITDPKFALDMASELRNQAALLRKSPDAGYETISYSVRRGGIAGFFGGRKTVTERRLKPGAQQLLDNAAMLDQQATYFTGLSKSLSSLADREKALDAAQAEAGKLKDEYVSVEHVLIAMLDEQSDIAMDWLAREGLSRFTDQSRGWVLPLQPDWRNCYALFG